MLQKLKKHNFYLVLIIILCLFFLRSLFSSVSPFTYDLEFNLARYYHYSQAIKEGQILPSWISNLANGYGYPLFIFSYHLPWIIGLPLIFLGLNFQLSLNLLFIISFIVSGFSMYALVYTLSNHSKYCAFVAAIIYLFNSFHLSVALIIGSIGMNFIFAFLPLIFLGIHLINEQKHKQGLIILTLSSCACILSHLMTTLMLIPIIFIYTLILFGISQKDYLNKFKYLLVSALLIIGINSFYLLPLIKYYPLIKASTQKFDFNSMYSRHFIDLQQLIKHNIKNDFFNGEISFHIGYFLLICVIFAWIILIKKKKYQKTIIPIIISCLSSLFLMLKPSNRFYETLTQFISIDFPYRFMTLFTFFIALSFSLWLQYQSKFIKIIILFITISVLVINTKQLKINNSKHINIHNIVDKQPTSNTYDEYLPKNADSQKLYNHYQAILTNNNYTIKKHNTKELIIEFQSKKSQYITIGQYDWPGQNIYINESKVSKVQTSNDLIKIKVNQGKSIIQIKYEKTFFQIISNIISLISLLIVIYFSYNFTVKK